MALKQIHMIRYFNLVTTSDVNLGVIKVEDTNYPIDRIKAAVVSHYDEQVTDIKVEYCKHVESLQISFTLEDGDTDYINGEPTQLLF